MAELPRLGRTVCASVKATNSPSSSCSARGPSPRDSADALRRTDAASVLISGGASVKKIQKGPGHSSAVITLQAYSHLWPGDDDRTRAVMEAALGGFADSLRTRGA